MLETSLAVLLGLVIGGAVSWYAGTLRNLLIQILNRKDKPEGGVVRPPSPALAPKPGPTVLSSTGVVRPPSPKQVAREAMEDARTR